MVPQACKCRGVSHVRYGSEDSRGTEDGFLLFQTAINNVDVQKCGTRSMLPNTQVGSHGCEASRESRVSGIMGMEWCGALRGITGP